MKITSICLISNDCRWGLAPDPSTESEQRLTISPSGRVWFSAKNYGQTNGGDGFCRKKQVNIGSWKAQFLLSHLEQVQERELGCDCGTYSLEIRYDNNTVKTAHGSMGENMIVSSYGKPVDLNKLLRRYVPIFALWGFDSSLSPDYEGKKAIYQFANKWEKRFSSEKFPTKAFEDSFGEECSTLGFQMDCREEFCRQFPNCFQSSYDNLEKDLQNARDVDVLGSAVFSQWRFLTHWAGPYDLNDYRRWFSVLLGQMKICCSL